MIIFIHTRGYSTGKEASPVGRGCRVDFDHISKMNNCVLCETRHTHEMVYSLSVEVPEPARAIVHPRIDFERVLAAYVALLGFAVSTLRTF